MTYPTISPKLTLDFANSRQLDPRITFSRSSSATYLHPDTGLITTVPDGVARFEKEGLLVEESRTNYCDYSQIDSTNWSQNGTASLSASVALAPDGGACFDLTTDSSGPNSVSLLSSSSPTGTVALSVFARFPNTGFTALNLRMFAVGGGASFYADFYPATESFSGLVNCTGSFERFANGWYRITIVSTVSSSAGSHEFRVGGGISSPSFTAQTCQVWGAQVETGSFQTSYIPTSGSTVTRAADVVSITGTSFSDWYSQGEGTLLTNITPHDVTNNDYAYSISDGTSSERIVSLIGNSFSHYIVDGGSIQAQINYAGYTANAETKAAATYATNDVAYATDGTVRGTDTSATIPAVDNLVIMANRSNGNHVTGHITRLSYYDRRVSDAALEVLTS